MGPLAGKTALISGGARGIGAAIARVFVEAGASVTIGDVLEEEGQKVAASLGESARFVRLDVTDTDDWMRSVSAAREATTRLDVLVNNAGVLRKTPIIGGSVDRFMQVTTVNQLGVYLGLQAAALVMAEHKAGSIINISSIDGMIGMSGFTGYVGSKWAVRGMTKAAALELGPMGIRCNSVHPGYINTNMLTGNGRLSAEDCARMSDGVPLGRVGLPDDVGRACLFLASDASSYLNGAELTIDGGLIAGLSAVP
jgi:3alpha(or 20beta)-hydroxysteroid dehydrogenase